MKLTNMKHTYEDSILISTECIMNKLHYRKKDKEVITCIMESLCTKLEPNEHISIEKLLDYLFSDKNECVCSLLKLEDLLSDCKQSVMGPLDECYIKTFLKLFIDYIEEIKIEYKNKVGKYYEIFIIQKSANLFIFKLREDTF